MPLISGKNDADRLANLTSEVPIGRLNLDNYAKQLRTGNARICRRPGDDLYPEQVHCWYGVMDRSRCALDAAGGACVRAAMRHHGAGTHGPQFRSPVRRMAAVTESWSAVRFGVCGLC